MHRIVCDPRLWTRIATREEVVGWLAVIFATTLAVGNPKNVLWQIAESGKSRAAWVVIFAVAGALLILMPKLLNRRAHFFLCVLSAFLWAYFGMQAWNIGAYGAAMMAAMSVTYLGLNARALHQGD